MNKKPKNLFRQLIYIIRLKEYLVESFIRLRKRLLIFLFFVIVAFFFWFYRALDDTYVEDIKYPVKFINLPTNKILTSIPPQKIVLQVRGDGYSILSKKFNAPPLTFDVNNFSLHYQTIDSLSVYLITQKAKESLTQQLISENEQLEIISISPDTIFFNFSNTRSKKVPIRPDFANPDILFAQQHTLNGVIRIKPDSATIVGSVQIIDSIDYIKTEPLLITDIKDTTKISTKAIPIKGVQLSTKDINITIPVDKFTETNFNTSLRIRNVPDSLILKVFPRNVRVNYRVTLSKYNDISENDFHPYVDYMDIKNSKAYSDEKLKVYLDSVPRHAFSTDVYPSIVEFIIESNNAEDWNNRRNR